MNYNNVIYEVKWWMSIELGILVDWMVSCMF